MQASHRVGRSAGHRIMGWQRKGGRGGMLVTVLVATIALIAASCGKSTPSTSSSPTGGPSSTISSPVGTKTTGGVVTWAEAPNVTPNYIFPIASSSYFGVPNLQWLQPLLYRPLYWFGNDYKASIDYDYSIGQQPVWSSNDMSVSITLNPYKWSDGETVTGRDVVFFMNVLKAEKNNYGGYVPGYFPDNVASVTATGQTVTFGLTAPQDPTWFQYNQLSEVTPFPLAWDVTAAGQPLPTTDNGKLPDTTTPGATAVFNYLSGLAKDTATYASNPIWNVINGPFKLTNFTSTGEADFVPNPNYNGDSFGAVKPTIAEFKELPFTSEDAEVNVSKTGSSNLTIGYLPAADVPQEASVASKGYDVYKLFGYSFNYFEMNLHNPTLGPVFSQLYFRQAFQELIDQPGWVSSFAHGTAQPTYGVIPLQPPSEFPDATETASFPYAFNPTKAKQLLTSHGWTVPTNGTSPATCTDPGTGPNQCGAGVAANTALSFNLDYQASVVALDQEMKDLKSQASKVGVILNLTTHPFNQVYSVAVQCKSGDADCNWTAQNWGGGWIYQPDYYPSGEELFATGAVSNQNNYSDPVADNLIKQSTVAPGDSAQAALNAYQDYMQQQLPVFFQPVYAGNPQPGGLTIVSNHLGGFTANAYNNITPETYYVTQ